MPRCAALVAGVVLLGSLGSLGAAHAGDDVDSTRATAPPAKPDSAAAATNPVEAEPARERLKFYVGDWRFTMTHMLSGPEPTVTEGTAHCEPILGGRYFRTETKAVMGDVPFDGLGISGYDGVTREHFHVWFDSASSGVMVSRGRMDEAETLLLTGRFADPRLGEVPYRMRTTVTGPDAYTIEMFMTFSPSDQEQKVMEAKYTRVKP